MFYNNSSFSSFGFHVRTPRKTRRFCTCHVANLSAFVLLCMRSGPCYIYYKRVDPYFCTELAPVLEGYVSRRRHLWKGTRVDRVCIVFVARCKRRFSYCSSKRIRGGSTFSERNSGPLKRHLLLVRTHNYINVTHG